MRVTRDWQHDEVTEQLGELVTEALEAAERRGELVVGFWSDEGGRVEVRLPGSDRRFRLVLEEVL